MKKLNTEMSRDSPMGRLALVTLVPYLFGDSDPSSSLESLSAVGWRGDDSVLGTQVASVAEVAVLMAGLMSSFCVA